MKVSFPREVELDAVTALPPRKILDHDLVELLRTMAASKLPMCSIMIDIDHFKKFNDTYGHSIGDIVLRHVSSIIRKIVRFRGEAYRYGGEEIVALMVNASAMEGFATAQRICKLIDSSSIDVILNGKKKSLSVQVSIGVSSTEQDIIGDELIMSSDIALYEAKENGRNKAVLFDKKLKDEATTTKIHVHFPARSAIQGGSYILLKSWFSKSDLTEIEAREIKDPNTDSTDSATGIPALYGLIQAEIRGKVSNIIRRDNYTDFEFEVKEDIIELMYKYILDAQRNR